MRDEEVLGTSALVAALHEPALRAMAEAWRWMLPRDRASEVVGFTTGYMPELPPKPASSSC
jgi:hypothetical protein